MKSRKTVPLTADEVRECMSLPITKYHRLNGLKRNTSHGTGGMDGKFRGWFLLRAAKEGSVQASVLGLLPHDHCATFCHSKKYLR
jgi:hypothetical protein